MPAENYANLSSGTTTTFEINNSKMEIVLPRLSKQVTPYLKPTES